MTDRPRILVFAYHNVGYECLNVLIKHGENIIGLFTHEDNPKEEIWFNSVAGLARQHGIPVYKPESVNTPEWTENIRSMQPEIIFSFYYRNMISEKILSIPRLGAYNMHGSLLPKYRGRVPINWAVLHGERETGATLHHMVKRADAGDIVDQEAVDIGPDDTAFNVFNKVTIAAWKVLERQLDAIKAGTAPRIGQDESQATYFGGRRPEDGRIDWTQSAEGIYNLIRAVTHPYPGAFTEFNGQRLFIWQAKPLGRGVGKPGTVLSIDPLRVATGSGSLEITRYQWEGDHEEAAADVTHDLRAGIVLGRSRD
jgi:methionyl-tRNA formyltransferase